MSSFDFSNEKNKSKPTTRWFESPQSTTVPQLLHLDILDVRLFLDVLALLREEVLGEDVQDVGAEDAVLLHFPVLPVREPDDGNVLKSV